MKIYFQTNENKVNLIYIGSMTQPPQSALLEKPRKVDIAAIERDLTQLWKTASIPATEDTIPPVIRACTLNFVVVMGGAGGLDATAELAGNVTIEHPSRLFLVALGDASGGSSLESWISARCSLSVPGRSQVCCEQVNLVARGAAVDGVPNIITSLLVPDVPSVVLWTLPAGKYEGLLMSLLSVVDRALIDSSGEASPADLLCAWHRLLKKSAGAVARATLGDLAWTHLTAWRSLTARMFQTDGMGKLLSKITRIEIRYSVSTSPRHSGLSQALLYTSWFAERIGWTLVDNAGRRGPEEFLFDFTMPGSGSLQVQATSTSAEPEGPGGIEAVSIMAGASVVLSLELQPGRDSVRSRRQLSGGSVEESIIPLTDQSESSVLARELEVVTGDALYESALEILGLMLKGVDG
jgi:glucose-6-phosphate dehydrogenase assembly protein OpcA